MANVPFLIGDATALIAIVACAIVSASLLLGKRVLFPTVVAHPWETPGTDGSRRRRRDSERTVVLAGSYNPPHRGHLAMIRYLSQRYGRVICCVGMNPDKTYDVSPRARAEMIRGMVRNLEGVSVEVVSGYIWRYAMSQSASIFYRGIRSWSTDGPEERRLAILNTWGPILFGPLKWPLPTEFIEGDPRYNHISSTLVRDMCDEAKREGREVDLTGVVPSSVAGKVAEAYGRAS